ncbi:MAG: DUF938 domain-containing protein [Gammaproteobacteria bacterium]|nr:DUF938 domain-containing protein [Gammaproteobacteria bacterium]
MNKPFSESCEQNKHVILEVLQGLFINPGKVLEVGSGTGQHAIFFSEAMTHLQWQPTDREENLSGIQSWIDEVSNNNLLPLHNLNVEQAEWSVEDADYVFSANTVHIMSWKAVQAFFAGLENTLNGGGLFVLYGPFNYDGQYSSDSNARFDQWLKQRDSLSGIRDFNDLDKLAQQAGLEFVHDYEMPVNNRILVWKKV